MQLCVHSQSLTYYPGQKNRYSRDIHEIDPHCNHVISCEIDFNLQRELATRRAAGRVDVEVKLDIARFHMIRLSDQPHEFLGCNDFFGQGSSTSLLRPGRWTISCTSAFTCMLTVEWISHAKKRADETRSSSNAKTPERSRSHSVRAHAADFETKLESAGLSVWFFLPIPFSAFSLTTQCPKTTDSARKNGFGARVLRTPKMVPKIVPALLAQGYGGRETEKFIIVLLCNRPTHVLSRTYSCQTGPGHDLSCPIHAKLQLVRRMSVGQSQPQNVQKFRSESTLCDQQYTKMNHSTGTMSIFLRYCSTTVNHSEEKAGN